MKFERVRVGDYFQFTKGLGYLGKYLNESNVGLIGLNSFVPGGGYKEGGEKSYSGPYKPQHEAAPGDLFIASTDITQDGRVLGSPLILPDDIDGYDKIIFSGDIVKALPTSSTFLPAYLYCVLRTKQAREVISYASTGSTVRRVPAEVIENFEVELPDLASQKAVIAFVAMLERKIQLNQQTSATLESIASTVFKSLFLEFSPLLNTPRGDERQVSDVWRREEFADGFQDSEIGPIPAGWTVATLPAIAEYRNGLALQKYPAIEGQPFLPVIKIPQVKSGSVEGAGIASAEVPEKFVVNDGDILFSWSGALEVTHWAGGKGALNQHLFKVVPKNVPNWFVYFSTLNHLPEFRTIAESKATTMGHIKRGHLDDAKLALPPDSVLDRATPFIGNLLEKALGFRVQIRTLTDLRDSSLPRLVAGTMRIPEGIGAL